MTTDFLFKNGDSERYWRRIDEASESLHRAGERVRARSEHFLLISWEVLTETYIRTSVPTDELTKRIWREVRSNKWKDDINEMFCQKGYREWLFINHTEGVRLELDISAVRKLQLQALKKIVKITGRRNKQMLAFSDCFTGSIKRELRRMVRINTDMINSIAGQIALNKSMNKVLKTELLEMIQESFHYDEEEEKEIE